MPTYAYVCKDCAHAFDVQQSFSDDSLTVCPECGGALRKQFGAVGVVFKGSGFYKTDSRDSDKKATASSSAKDTSSKDSSAKDSGKDSGKDSSTTSKSADSSGSSASSSANTTSGSSSTTTKSSDGSAA